MGCARGIAKRVVATSVDNRYFCAMKSNPGTYALILHNRSKDTTHIGRWGQIHLEAGYYIYIGSAFGPGGVKARVSRHFRKRKPKHWHIDYLRDILSPVGAWYTHDGERLEHRWAQLLSDVSGISSIQRFGCSDCNCHSHLFYTSAEPNLALFSNIVGSEVESWLYLPAN